MVEQVLSPTVFVHVNNTNTKIRSLVDTGAEIFVVPPKLENKPYRQDSTLLHAVIGFAIDMYGQKSITLNMGLRQRLSVNFLVTEVQQVIIGADFLRYFVQIVVVKRNLLHYSGPHLTVQ